MIDLFFLAPEHFVAVVKKTQLLNKFKSRMDGSCPRDYLFPHEMKTFSEVLESVPTDGKELKTNFYTYKFSGKYEKQNK